MTSSKWWCDSNEWSESHSVESDSLWTHGLYRPWNSPGQHTGVGSCSLLLGIFPAQELNPGPSYYRQILYQLSHKRSLILMRGRCKHASGTIPDLDTYCQSRGLPRWLSSKESACQYGRCRGHRFDPWVGKIPWRRKWQHTPVFLPGKSQGQRSLASYSLWGLKELDTTEYAHSQSRTK